MTSTSELVTFRHPYQLPGLHQPHPLGAFTVESYMDETSSTHCAELGLIDEQEFVVQPRLAGRRPGSFAGLSKYVELKLVDRRELSSGVVVLRYEPGR